MEYINLKPILKGWGILGSRQKYSQEFIDKCEKIYLKKKETDPTEKKDNVMHLRVGEALFM